MYAHANSLILRLKTKAWGEDAALSGNKLGNKYICIVGIIYTRRISTNLLFYTDISSFSANKTVIKHFVVQCTIEEINVNNISMPKKHLFKK